MKISIPELDTRVSFLCKRIQEKMIEYWGKLRILLVFLKATKNDQRNLGMDDYSRLETWIDTSHALHPNTRGHTGGVMSFGWFVVNGNLSKRSLTPKV